MWTRVFQHLIKEQAPEVLLVLTPKTFTRIELVAVTYVVYRRNSVLLHLLLYRLCPMHACSIHEEVKLASTLHLVIYVV